MYLREASRQAHYHHAGNFPSPARPALRPREQRRVACDDGQWKHLRGPWLPEAGRLLGVTQPRISDLKRGKIGQFTVDALLNMLGHAGIKVRVTFSRPKKSAA